MIKLTHVYSRSGQQAVDGHDGAPDAVCGHTVRSVAVGRGEGAVVARLGQHVVVLQREGVLARPGGFVCHTAAETRVLCVIWRKAKTDL